LLDILYVTGSVAFFALMLAYVAGCERLGRVTDVESTTSGARQ
jgi:hypothetical protein